MKFKKGVKLNGIKPETVIALIVADSVISKYIGECTTTSCVDGKHSLTSLHYVGYAVDIRTRDLDESVLEQVADGIRDRLTDEYDVILESTHIHIEFQPKGGR